MKYLNRLLVVASAAFFIAGAQAQNAGTVTNHAFAIGKGAGVQGYGSLVLGSGQIAVGQASADPSAITPSGDVTMNASGVTAIGANKVTNSQLRQSGALALIGRSANSTGNVADIQATAGSSCVFVESSSSLTCAAITAANIAANAVTNAKLAQMPANTVKCNPTGSTANAQDCTSLPLAIGGLGGSQSAATANQVPVYPGSSGAASPTSAASWFDAFCSTTIGNFWVRQTGGWGCTSLGYANPVWWGADPTGGTDSTAAFNAALAASNNIKFPPGRFIFLSTITYNIPSGINSVTIGGAGQDVTKLAWLGGTTDGLIINYANTNSSAHIHHLTLATAVFQGGAALSLKAATPNTTPGTGAVSDIYSVAMHGDDGYAIVESWATGVAINNVSNVNIDGLSVTSAGNNGTGISIVGIPASTSFAVVLNVSKSIFNNLNAGIIYGNFVQGVTVDQSNFTEDNIGIISVAGSSGLDQLTVTSSQFNTVSQGINLLTPVASSQFIGNLFIVNSNSIGINLVADRGVIMGNAFQCVTLTQTQAIVFSSGTGGMVSGNSINNCTSGVGILAAATGINVQSNFYLANTANVTNLGTGNTIGGGSQ